MHHLRETALPSIHALFRAKLAEKSHGYCAKLFATAAVQHVITVTYRLKSVAKSQDADAKHT
jgi:hypothetical protein